MDFQKYAKFQAMPDTSESGAVVENVKGTSINSFLKGIPFIHV